MDYKEYLGKAERLTDIETARCRSWGYFLGAYLTGPIWPGVIAARTKRWTPFWGATAVGVCFLPVAMFDWGILSSLPPAALGTALMAGKTKDARKKLDIVMAEEADMLRFTSFTE